MNAMFVHKMVQTQFAPFFEKKLINSPEICTFDSLHHLLKKNNQFT